LIRLADIVRQVGSAYLVAFGDRMLPSHWRVLADIERCRTPALGGSVYRCDDPQCEKEHYSFHSCCNRHCPQCQGDQARPWLEKVRSLLLPCPYYFITFTLPARLRPVARSNQKVVYSLLMKEAAATIRELAGQEAWVGGQLAMMAALHTWGRNLSYHVHVHFLVTAGGLSRDGLAWFRPANPKFLMPGHKLSCGLRQRMRIGLEQADLLDFVDRSVWDQRWVVKVQHAGDGEKVAEYLSRYVYRVALAESRIERFEDGQVTYRYTDSKAHKTRRLTLSAPDFLARFLQHVLPRGLVKIRYYGLWASACRKRLHSAQEILEGHPSTLTLRAPEPTDSGDPISDGESIPEQAPRICPHCRKGHLVFIRELPRRRGPP
jgi:hypothetical protein